MKKWKKKWNKCPNCGGHVWFGTKTVQCSECKVEWKYADEVK